MGARESVLRFEKDVQENQARILAAERQLAEARNKERDLTHSLTIARQQCTNYEMSRAARTRAHQERIARVRVAVERGAEARGFATPTRGREREEADADVTEVAGPAGSACPPGWQSRRTRARPAPPAEVQGATCGICLAVPRLPETAEARCSREKCAFEACYVCWTQQAEINGTCPGCRARITLLDSSEEE